MRTLFLVFAIVGMTASVTLGADPDYEQRLDIADQDFEFTYKSHRASTPLLRARLYNNGVKWQPDATWGGLFGYGLDYEDSTSMVQVAGTVSTNDNYIDFQFTAADANTNGRFFAQIMLTNTSGKAYIFNDGILHLEKSPLSGGATAASFGATVSWGTITTFLGDGPWLNAPFITFTNLGGTYGDVLHTAGAAAGTGYWASVVESDPSFTNWLNTNGYVQAVSWSEGTSNNVTLSAGTLTITLNTNYAAAGSDTTFTNQLFGEGLVEIIGGAQSGVNTARVTAAAVNAIETDQVWGGASNTVVYTNDTEYTTTVALAAGAVQTEVDPIWGGASNTVVYTNDATYTDTVANAGSALQIELDPLSLHTNGDNEMAANLNMGGNWLSGDGDSEGVLVSSDGSTTASGLDGGTGLLVSVGSTQIAGANSGGVALKVSGGGAYIGAGNAGFSPGVGGIEVQTLVQVPRINMDNVIEFRTRFDDGARIALEDNVNLNNNLMIVPFDSRADDFDHDAGSPDPTLFMQSQTDPDVSNNEWGSFTHNNNDLIISTGPEVGTGTGPTTNEQGITFAPRETDRVWIKGDGRVGIGTNAPSELLDVNGDAVVRGTLDVVGGGQSKFSGTLRVDGQIKAGNGSASAPSISFNDDLGMGFYRVTSGQMGWSPPGSSGKARWSSVGLRLGSGLVADSALSVTGGANISGDVGIGTNMPGSALDVNGSVEVRGSLNAKVITNTITVLDDLNPTGVLLLGAETTSQGLATTGDLVVRKLEANSGIYLDGEIFTDIRLIDNLAIGVGASADARFEWTTIPVVDVFHLALSTPRVLEIVDTAALTDDYGTTEQANPTIKIMSSTRAGTASNQWLSFAHDKTNAIFGLGKGKYLFPDGVLDATAGISVGGNLNMGGNKATNAASGTESDHLATVGQLTTATNSADIVRQSKSNTYAGGVTNDFRWSLILIDDAAQTNSPITLAQAQAMTNANLAAAQAYTDVATNANLAAAQAYTDSATNALDIVAHDGEVDTLQTVTSRGSNTTENLWLEGDHTTIGLRGTEYFEPGKLGMLSSGYNTGTRTNTRHGAENTGYNIGVQTATGDGSKNSGLNVDTQIASGPGSKNAGHNAGVQIASGQGSRNSGRNAGTQLASGLGAQNSGYNESSQTASGIGSQNSGYNAGTQTASGDGSHNSGYVLNGESQSVSGNGSANFGANNNNTYDYAYAFGYGVDTYETNSVSARRYWENGEPLDEKYIGTNGVAAVQGDLVVTNGGTLYVDGIISGDCVGGQLYFDGSEVQNLTSNYVAMTNMVSTNLNNMTATHTSLVVSVTGVYSAYYKVEGNLDNNESAGTAIHVNGVEAVNAKDEAETPAVGINHIHGSAAALLSLSAGDVVTVAAKSGDAAANFSKHTIQLVLHRLN